MQEVHTQGGTSQGAEKAMTLPEFKKLILSKRDSTHAETTRSRNRRKSHHKLAVPPADAV